MHEMAIVSSLLQMAEAEAARANCRRILRVRVIYGALTGIMPEALALCFEAQIRGTIHEGAKLELEFVPARFRCPFCGARFAGNDGSVPPPCPKCGEEFGHIVERGRELLLGQLEASPD